MSYQALLAEELYRNRRNLSDQQAVPMDIGPMRDVGVTPMGEAPTASSVNYQGYVVPAQGDTGTGMPFEELLGDWGLAPDRDKGDDWGDYLRDTAGKVASALGPLEVNEDGGSFEGEDWVKTVGNAIWFYITGGYGGGGGGG